MSECPVCGSVNHIHCSKGCAGCDDPDSLMPRYAFTYCPKCRQSFCVECMRRHLHLCPLSIENEQEHWAVRDLAIGHYLGKWKAAKEFAASKFDIESHDWWMAARLHYLELGGEYKEQMPRSKQ